MSKQNLQPECSPRRRQPYSGPTLVAVGFCGYVVTAACIAVMVGLIPSTSTNAQTDDHRWLLAVAAAVGFLSAVVAIIGAVRWAVYGPSRPLLRRGEDQTMQLLNSINDRLLISDGAKHIAYRRQDRDTLRQAIQEDIAKGDFESALVLAHEIGNVYGYQEESKQIRGEIQLAREAEMQRKVTIAISTLDELLATHQWPRAMQEADKFQRLYHDSPQVEGLVQHARDSFEQYKQDLKKQLIDAGDHSDFDRAMDLLTEIDPYLSPAEAEELRDLARTVIAKKRENLGVQFRMAARDLIAAISPERPDDTKVDSEWSRARRVGDQIIEQFPNTKMATEVRDALDGLQQRLDTRKQEVRA